MRRTELLRGRVLRRFAGDHVTLELERARDDGRELPSALGQRAEGGETSREHAARRALGLEQRTEREQVVAQRLALELALATHLEAPQRPCELVAPRAAAGRRGCRSAQLILLRLGHHEHPVRASRRRAAPRAPAAAHARTHARPPSATRPSPKSRSAHRRSRNARTALTPAAFGSSCSLVCSRQVVGLVGQDRRARAHRAALEGAGLCDSQRRC